MKKENLPVLTGLILDEEVTFTLGELSRACDVHAEWIIALVQEGLLEPSGAEVSQWQFPGGSLRRARAALRLQQELDINLAGAALVLDLMDEIETLRSRLRRWEPEY